MRQVNCENCQKKRNIAFLYTEHVIKGREKQKAIVWLNTSKTKISFVWTDPLQTGYLHLKYCVTQMEQEHRKVLLYWVPEVSLMHCWLGLGKPWGVQKSIYSNKMFVPTPVHDSAYSQSISFYCFTSESITNCIWLKSSVLWTSYFKELPFS